MKLVAFPYHDWRKGQVEGLRWRDGHLLEEFSADSRVDHILVVDRPVSRIERLARRGAPTVAGEMVDRRQSASSRASLTRVSPKVTVLDIAVDDTVAVIRGGRRWWFDVFRRSDVLDHVRWAATTVVGERPRAIAWIPTAEPAVAAIDPSGFVYDSLDNWLLHPQLKRYQDLIVPSYEQLCTRARRVIVSAPRSKEVMTRWTDRVDIVPNGVTPSMFAGPFDRPVDLPGAPIVGYAGSLGPRVDAEFVLEVAARLPHVQFIFIGQQIDTATPRKLRGSPNVQVLGDRHYDLLPAYLRSFDIAWIPHSVGERESGGDPIKLYEYWAADREVVSTAIDGMAAWSESLHLVSTPEEAQACISGLLDGTIAARRAAVPPERTWASIASRILEILEPDGGGER